MIKVCLVCKKEFCIQKNREKTAKYCSQQCMGKDNNANWSNTRFKKGHKSLVEAKSDGRNSVLWNKWREKVFKRDNYTCQDCGETERIIILPHHLNSYDDFPKLRLDISNGITLCRSCHPKRHYNQLIKNQL